MTETAWVAEPKRITHRLITRTLGDQELGASDWTRYSDNKRVSNYVLLETLPVM
jgi:hypothetical protein